MLVAARVVCKAPLTITQGGYNAGGVAASAGTHDRDALDIGAANLSSGQRSEAVNILRKVGFAAWLRNPTQGDWGWHIHCVPIGGDLSAGAARQVTAYKNGRNGLANNGPDDGPRTWVAWTWERYKKTYPNLLTEDQMTPAQMAEVKAYITSELTRFFSFLEKENGNLDQQLAATEAVVKELVDAGETDVKNYMAAVSGSIKDYVRQTDNEGDILVAVTKLAEQVTALTTKVDALPKV